MAESDRNAAASVLSAYRSWKEEGASLKARAQGCLMDRFAELVREAQQVQHDLWEDFGQTVKFPANPKPAKKGRGRAAPRKVAVPSPAAQSPVRAVQSTAPAVTPPAAAPVSSARKAVKAISAPLRAPQKRAAAPEASAESQRRQLARKLEKAEARLKAARETGDPVRVQNAEDRVYELNDDLRLLAEQLP